MALQAVNASLRLSDPRHTVSCLMTSDLQLPQVFPFAATLYHRELQLLQRQTAQVHLHTPDRRHSGAPLTQRCCIITAAAIRCRLIHYNTAPLILPAEADQHWSEISALAASETLIQRRRRRIDAGSLHPNSSV